MPTNQSANGKERGSLPRKKGKSCCSFIKTLSVEPAAFLIVMAVVVAHLAFQNVMMETICQVDLSYDAETCKEIINKVNITFKAEEREIQKVAAGVTAMTSIISSSITVIVVLFIGPWSDMNGRKVPILLSIVGLMGMSGMMIIGYMCLGKIRALAMSLLVMLPMMLTGGIGVFGMAANCYVSDTTTPKNRTIRTGILSAAFRSGMPIGLAVAGLLLKSGIGIIPSLIFSMGLSSTAFLIVLCTVNNVNPHQPKNVDGSVRSSPNRASCWRKYNPVTKLVQAFAILGQKSNRNATFYLLILVHICYAVPNSEHSMIYLFVRERLQWNISTYGFFAMFNWILSAAGGFLSMYILSKTFKLPDSVIGFVSGISQIGGSTLYAFTTTGVMMYCASAMDMMNGTIGVVVRSMLSKLVAANEVGKLFSLLGVIDSLLPLVTGPTYALVYRSTVAEFAGAFFLLSAAVTIPAEIIFLYFMVRKVNPTMGTNQHGNDDPTALDQMQSTLESLNKSVPDLARMMQHDIRLSRDKIQEQNGNETEIEESKHLRG